jgi:hypothetical protein
VADLAEGVAPSLQQVTADAEARTLKVVVADDQLSLAIGRRGQNARLAAKLVGWKVDIRSTTELQREAEAALSGLMAGEAKPEAPAPADEGAAAQPLTVLPGVGEKLATRLITAGFGTVASLADASMLIGSSGTMGRYIVILSPFFIPSFFSAEANLFTSSHSCW